MTDISTIVAAERTIDILHPATQEPIGLKITLRPDSDEVVAAARRKFQNEKLLRGKKITAELLEALQTNLIVASVTGWEWIGDANFRGEKPAFTEGNLRKVMKELGWFKKQLDQDLGDEAAFFPS